MLERKYMWANSLKYPTFERLDRVLISTDWERYFPLATIVALSREISNHTPLLLNTGGDERKNQQPLFKFKLGWLLKQGFIDTVLEVWNK